MYFFIIFVKLSTPLPNISNVLYALCDTRFIINDSFVNKRGFIYLPLKKPQFFKPYNCTTAGYSRRSGRPAGRESHTVPTDLLDFVTIYLHV